MAYDNLFYYPIEVAPGLSLQPGTTMATQPTSWLSRLQNITPGQVGGIAAVLGTLGKTLMHPGNPMQGAADAAIKFGPGLAQREMINGLISALAKSRPAEISSPIRTTQPSGLGGLGGLGSLKTSSIMSPGPDFTENQFINPNFILK